LQRDGIRGGRQDDGDNYIRIVSVRRTFRKESSARQAYIVSTVLGWARTRLSGKAEDPAETGGVSCPELEDKMHGQIIALANG
jgi:hypothetical protein